MCFSVSAWIFFCQAESHEHHFFMTAHIQCHPLFFLLLSFQRSLNQYIKLKSMWIFGSLRGHSAGLCYIFISNVWQREHKATQGRNWLWTRSATLPSQWLTRGWQKQQIRGPGHNAKPAENKLTSFLLPLLCWFCCHIHIWREAFQWMHATSVLYMQTVPRCLQQMWTRS